MPGVPADHVGDAQRALHDRADLVALLDVLPPTRLGTAPASDLVGVRGVDARRSRRRCTAGSRSSSYLRFSPVDRRSVRIMSRYCMFSATSGFRAANTSAVHSCTARSANSLPLVVHARRARCDGRRPCPAAAAPTTRGSCRRRRRARHRAGRPSAAPGVSGVERRDLVLADERVAAVEGRRRDRPAPHAGAGVVGIAPQRVVVAVGLGDVAERVLVRGPVVRRLRMRLRDADAGAERARRPRR